MRKIARSVTLVLALANTVAAQTFPEIGARSLGLGGAFVAIADGPTAGFWNPAGLPLGPPATSVLWGRTTSDPEGLAERLDDLAATDATADDISTRFAASIRAVELLGAIGSEPDPILGEEPIGLFYGGGSPYGLSYYRLRLVQATPVVDELNVDITGESEQSLSNNASRLQLASLTMQDVVVSMAGTLGDPRLMLGLSGRWSRGETRREFPSLFGFPDFAATDVFDELSGSQTTTSDAFSFDVGTLITVHPKIRLGTVGKYLGSPKFDLGDGTKIEVKPRWRSGIAVFATDSLTLTSDIDLTKVAPLAGGVDRRHFAFGAQVGVAEGRGAVRAGFREAVSGPNARLVTGGVGFLGENVAIDLAVGYAPTTSSTRLAVEIGWRRASR